MKWIIVEFGISVLFLGQNFFDGVKLSSADEFAAEFDAPGRDDVEFNVTPLELTLPDVALWNLM